MRHQGACFGATIDLACSSDIVDWLRIVDHRGQVTIDATATGLQLDEGLLCDHENVSQVVVFGHNQKKHQTI